MDEQHNGFDHSAESGGPEIDDSANPTESSPEHDEPRPVAGREMLTQLQQMIDTVSYQAAPVMREVAAKAAELAAAAGAKAGPLAYKAAEVTDQFGQKVAARSKSVADDLRRMRDDGTPSSESPSGESDASASTPEGSESEDSAPGL